MSQPITSPFRYRDDPRPSIAMSMKTNANQYTAGRKVNLAPMPATSFCSHIATPKESDRTNSIKGAK